MRTSLGAVIIAGLLAGCGGGTLPADEDDFVDYSHLELTQPTTAALVLADEATLGKHIKNGIRLSLESAGSGGWSASSSGGGWSSTASSSSSSSGSSSNTSSSSGGFSGSSSNSNSSSSSSSSSGGSGGEVDGSPDPFSDINVHVAGVDESDFARFDGTHWFIATTEARSNNYTLTGGPGFQVVRPNTSAPDARILGQFRLEDSWGEIGQMYLVSDNAVTTHVVLVREQYGSVPSELPRLVPMTMSSSSGAAYWGPGNGKVLVHLVEVEDPSTPTAALDIQLDGTLLDTRKIGDVLYLVTRFEPWVDGLQVDYGDAALRRQNEAALAEKPITGLLPHVQIGDAARQPLASRCYIQDGLKENAGFTSLVNITAIDVREQKLLASR